MAITGLRKGFLILLLAVAGGGTVLWAQLPATAVVSASPASEVDAGAVRLLVGRSTVLDVGTPITRVSLTSADIADALVTSPNQLLINGKMPGAISRGSPSKSGRCFPARRLKSRAAARTWSCRASSATRTSSRRP